MRRQAWISNCLDKWVYQLKNYLKFYHTKGIQ
jgi:hypothetical protein